MKERKYNLESKGHNSLFGISQGRWRVEIFKAESKKVKREKKYQSEGEWRQVGCCEAARGSDSALGRWRRSKRNDRRLKRDQSNVREPAQPKSTNESAAILAFVSPSAPQGDKRAERPCADRAADLADIQRERERAECGIDARSGEMRKTRRVAREERFEKRCEEVKPSQSVPEWTSAFK